MSTRTINNNLNQTASMVVAAAVALARGDVVAATITIYKVQKLAMKTKTLTTYVYVCW